MRLYAGGAHGLVQEYAYTHVNDSWAVGFTFPSTNGFAGISGAWFPYLLTQAILVVTNANGELELWWKDTDPRATGNATHPVGEWVRGMSVSNRWTCDFLLTRYYPLQGLIPLEASAPTPPSATAALHIIKMRMAKCSVSLRVV